MDSKKANLTPELKEIYDRVMNTSGTSKPPAQAQNTTPTTLSQQPQGAVPPPTMPPSPAMPAMGVPVQPPGQADPMQAPAQPQMSAAPQMPGMPSVGEMNPAEEALSSTPARPLNGGNTFALNGKGKAPAQTANATGVKKKTPISKPLLIILGVAFVAVWGIFWAIIFGFIQR